MIPVSAVYADLPACLRQRLWSPVTGRQEIKPNYFPIPSFLLKEKGSAKSSSRF